MSAPRKSTTGAREQPSAAAPSFRVVSSTSSKRKREDDGAEAAASLKRLRQEGDRDPAEEKDDAEDGQPGEEENDEDNENEEDEDSEDENSDEDDDVDSTMRAFVEDDYGSHPDDQAPDLTEEQAKALFDQEEQKLKALESLTWYQREQAIILTQTAKAEQEDSFLAYLEEKYANKNKKAVKPKMPTVFDQIDKVRHLQDPRNRR